MFSRVVRFGVRANNLYSPPNYCFLKTTNYFKLNPVIHNDTNLTIQNRSYKNFGHKPPKVSRFTKVWYSFILVMLILPTIDYRWYVFITIFLLLTLLYCFGRLRRTLFPPVKAQSETIGDIEQSDEGSEDETKKKKHRKEKIGFRDRKVSSNCLTNFPLMKLSDNRIRKSYASLFHTRQNFPVFCYSPCGNT